MKLQLETLELEAVTPQENGRLPRCRTASIDLCSKVYAAIFIAMTQVLDSLPAVYTDRIFCYYVNSTRKIQIIRIVNISGWYFERVVFPTERILFESLPEAQLEVHTTRLTRPILLEHIACNRLRIYEGASVSRPVVKLENFAEQSILHQA